MKTLLINARDPKFYAPLTNMTRRSKVRLFPLREIRSRKKKKIGPTLSDRIRN